MSVVEKEIKSQDKELFSDKKINDEYENVEKESIQKFKDFITKCRRLKKNEDQELLWKAFYFANNAFKGIKKNPSEYYIEHSINVAKIVVNDIGLGTKSAIVALLHDIVDETDIQIEDIKTIFGDKIASILSGLTKIREVIDSQNIVQAEAFRKILLTLSADIRVIFIKIADRLHHMRTIKEYSEKKQLKTVAESLYVYVPLAHRLGLYNIKTELEDLSLKFKHPEIYNEIASKISGTEKKRIQFITNFSLPIIKSLSLQNIDFEIDGRAKSIYSVWSKMQKKNIRFEEVYDLFAIRIVFNPSSPEKEIEECWKIYSSVTKIYEKANPGRIRDWITQPKQNGYEALHLTVLSPQNRWVEVQIRSKRMNEIAEMGFASHWKYKGIEDKKSELDVWIGEIKDKLNGNSESTLDFFDSFNINLFSSEILVFTPKGKIITLPKDATVLDFAFEIHSDIALSCIGAKIGRTVVPVNYQLSSGDIVEVLTSSNQRPVEKWFNYVVTNKAKKALSKVFNEEKQYYIREGKKAFKYLIAKNKIIIDFKILKKTLKYFNLSTKKDLYLQIGNETIDKIVLIKIIKEKSTNKFVKYWKLQFSETDLLKTLEHKESKIKIDELKLNSFIEIASCCNPIPGDEVIGCESDEGKICIHKSNCKELKSDINQECKEIIKAKWTAQEIASKLYRIELTGEDIAGLANKVTSIIAVELDINIKSLHFDTLHNKFYGMVDIYIADNEVINNLVEKLRNIKGVEQVIIQKDFDI
ncbi:MAG: bifunctional (p)ppGpp synthetase/guanosine-3',5'-bis(diphosphate) 3'-pyrophosphohydrolase [Bacteroidales bacterium]|nr:bifunctional (p)ppGpp synthetase/guanosine-3',5'-bis(diphosphate) 3'-pyrophosphohydrolase [Bacteroidales bacterium]MBN2756650.1 bifunctional (p)ppGpp synthetase/guanosine-3',5'-bis(diphosphate) 3'-pyrophosphohydrolase [Bacteroidales bacterium]